MELLPFYRSPEGTPLTNSECLFLVSLSTWRVCERRWGDSIKAKATGELSGYRQSTSTEDDVGKSTNCINLDPSVRNMDFPRSKRFPQFGIFLREIPSRVFIFSWGCGVGKFARRNRWLLFIRSQYIAYIRPRWVIILS